MTNELQPTFTVTVDLDPDDDPDMQSDNVYGVLESVLIGLREQGLIRSFVLREQAH